MSFKGRQIRFTNVTEYGALPFEHYEDMGGYSYAGGEGYLTMGVREAIIENGLFESRWDDLRGRAQRFIIFGEPTAADANVTPATHGTEYTGRAEISPESGFYTGSQVVVMNTTFPEEQIRYTLDGSKPSSSLPTGKV